MWNERVTSYVISSDISVISVSQNAINNIETVSVNIVENIVYFFILRAVSYLKVSYKYVKIRKHRRKALKLYKSF